jgi:hypothetical protein
LRNKNYHSADEVRRKEKIKMQEVEEEDNLEKVEVEKILHGL